jgi:hypothetical protein
VNCIKRTEWNNEAARKSNRCNNVIKINKIIKIKNLLLWQRWK